MSTAVPSYFADPDRLAQLHTEAQSWLRTPFMHRAAIKGVGADCVTFTAELMLACGVIDGYQFPRYSLDWARHQTRSLILEWLELCPRVALVPAAHPVLPGDVVCYKIGKCVHHCAVVLRPPTLIHAIIRHEVDLGRLDDSTLAKRFTCAYRPLPR